MQEMQEMQEPHPNEAQLRPLELEVRGMSCDNCAAGITKALLAAPGVRDPQVSFALGEARLRFDPSATQPQAIIDLIVAKGYEASTRKPPSGHDAATRVEAELREVRDERIRGRRVLVGALLSAGATASSV